jgi:hypothetical protein
MDFEDYEEVVKSYMDDSITYRIMPNFIKEATVFVRKNEAEFEDSFVQFGFKDKKKFVSISTTNVDLYHRRAHVMTSATVRFVIDPKQETYERVIFSIFDLTGQVGGLYEVFEVVGAFVIGYFTEKLFYYSMFKRIYHVKASIPERNCWEFDQIQKEKTFSKKGNSKVRAKAKIPRKIFEESKYGAYNCNCNNLESKQEK